MPKLTQEIAVLIQPLLDRGIEVYVYDKDTYASDSWIIITRNGNVGTIGHRRYVLGGYYVNFAITPSRQSGSSLMVMRPDGQEPVTEQEVIEAAELAVGDRYANFATAPQGMPNHGWKHFDWCRGALVKIEKSLLQESTS